MRHFYPCLPNSCYHELSKWYVDNPVDITGAYVNAPFLPGHYDKFALDVKSITLDSWDILVDGIPAGDRTGGINYITTTLSVQNQYGSDATAKKAETQHVVYAIDGESLFLHNKAGPDYGFDGINGPESNARIDLNTRDTISFNVHGKNFFPSPARINENAIKLRGWWKDVATAFTPNGGLYTLAIDSDGKLYGWGDNTYGCTGRPAPILSKTFYPRVLLGSSIDFIDTVEQHEGPLPQTNFKYYPYFEDITYQVEKSYPNDPGNGLVVDPIFEYTFDDIATSGITIRGFGDIDPITISDEVTFEINNNEPSVIIDGQYETNKIFSIVDFNIDYQGQGYSYAYVVFPYDKNQKLAIAEGILYDGHLIGAIPTAEIFELEYEKPPKLTVVGDGIGAVLTPIWDCKLSDLFVKKHGSYKYYDNIKITANNNSNNTKYTYLDEEELSTKMYGNLSSWDIINPGSGYTSAYDYPLQINLFNGASLYNKYNMYLTPGPVVDISGQMPDNSGYKFHYANSGQFDITLDIKLGPLNLKWIRDPINPMYMKNIYPDIDAGEGSVVESGIDAAFSIRNPEYIKLQWADYSFQTGIDIYGTFANYGIATQPVRGMGPYEEMYPIKESRFIGIGNTVYRGLGTIYGSNFSDASPFIGYVRTLFPDISDAYHDSCDPTGTNVIQQFESASDDLDFIKYFKKFLPRPYKYPNLDIVYKIYDEENNDTFKISYDYINNSGGDVGLNFNIESAGSRFTIEPHIRASTSTVSPIQILSSGGGGEWEKVIATSDTAYGLKNNKVYWWGFSAKSATPVPVEARVEITTEDRTIIPDEYVLNLQPDMRSYFGVVDKNSLNGAMVPVPGCEDCFEARLNPGLVNPYENILYYCTDNIDNGKDQTQNTILSRRSNVDIDKINNGDYDPAEYLAFGINGSFYSLYYQIPPNASMAENYASSSLNIYPGQSREFKYRVDPPYTSNYRSYTKSEVREFDNILDIFKFCGKVYFKESNDKIYYLDNFEITTETGLAPSGEDNIDIKIFSGSYMFNSGGTSVVKIKTRFGNENTSYWYNQGYNFPWPIAGDDYCSDATYEGQPVPTVNLCCPALLVYTSRAGCDFDPSSAYNTTLYSIPKPSTYKFVIENSGTGYGVKTDCGYLHYKNKWTPKCDKKLILKTNAPVQYPLITTEIGVQEGEHIPFNTENLLWCNPSIDGRSIGQRFLGVKQYDDNYVPPCYHVDSNIVDRALSSPVPYTAPIELSNIDRSFRIWPQDTMGFAFYTSPDISVKDPYTGFEARAITTAREIELVDINGYWDEDSNPIPGTSIKRIVYTIIGWENISLGSITERYFTYEYPGSNQIIDLGSTIWPDRTNLIFTATVLKLTNVTDVATGRYTYYEAPSAYNSLTYGRYFEWRNWAYQHTYEDIEIVCNDPNNPFIGVCGCSMAYLVTEEIPCKGAECIGYSPFTYQTYNIGYSQTVDLVEEPRNWWNDGYGDIDITDVTKIDSNGCIIEVNKEYLSGLLPPHLPDIEFEIIEYTNNKPTYSGGASGRFSDLVGSNFTKYGSIIHTTTMDDLLNSTKYYVNMSGARIDNDAIITDDDIIINGLTNKIYNQIHIDNLSINGYPDLNMPGIPSLQCDNVASASKIESIINGKITSIAVEKGGSGFFAPPNVYVVGKLADGGKDGSLQAVIEGPIVGIEIIDGGIGYKHPPTIKFDGAGIPPIMSVNLDEKGSIVSVSIDNDKEEYHGKYRTRPNIILDDEVFYPDTENRSANLRAILDGSVIYIKIIDSGSYYQYPPDVVIDTTNNYKIPNLFMQLHGDVISRKEYDNHEYTATAQAQIKGPLVKVNIKDTSIKYKTEQYTRLIGGTFSVQDAIGPTNQFVIPGILLKDIPQTPQNALYYDYIDPVFGKTTKWGAHGSLRQDGDNVIVTTPYAIPLYYPYDIWNIRYVTPIATAPDEKIEIRIDMQKELYEHVYYIRASGEPGYTNIPTNCEQTTFRQMSCDTLFGDPESGYLDRSILANNIINNLPSEFYTAPTIWIKEGGMGIIPRKLKNLKITGCFVSPSLLSSINSTDHMSDFDMDSYHKHKLNIDIDDPDILISLPVNECIYNSKYGKIPTLKEISVNLKNLRWSTEPLFKLYDVAGSGIQLTTVLNEENTIDSIVTNTNNSNGLYTESTKIQIENVPLLSEAPNIGGTINTAYNSGVDSLSINQIGYIYNIIENIDIYVDHNTGSGFDFILVSEDYFTIKYALLISAGSGYSNFPTITITPKQYDTSIIKNTINKKLLLSKNIITWSIYNIEYVYPTSPELVSDEVIAYDTSDEGMFCTCYRHDGLVGVDIHYEADASFNYAGKGGSAEYTFDGITVEAISFLTNTPTVTKKSGYDINSMIFNVSQFGSGTFIQNYGLLYDF